MSLGLDLVICPVLCFFYCYCDHRDLHVLTHSFPTRRSSDLTSPTRPRVRTAATTGKCSTPPRPDRGTCSGSATSSDPGRFVGTPLLRDTGFPAPDGPSRERPQLPEAGRGCTRYCPRSEGRRGGKKWVRSGRYWGAHDT